MTDFNTSNWAKPEFSRGYREHADIFIVERRKMLSILQSFYLHFIKDGRRKSMLDLGCGDGIVAYMIAKIEKSISVTLVDGSRDMLEKARERLKGLIRPNCIHSSFQEMIREEKVHGKFNFIASSLAIHHLTMQEKAAVYDKIYRLLNRGGYFANIDVVLAPSPSLEQWYLSLWKDWIDERAWDFGVKDDRLNNIIKQYKEADENKPDTLKDQLNVLEKVGFRDVDCYYKNGIFTIFGGSRPR